ncbi:dihydropyrimidinase [Extibacter muris]|uniref:dihydropyrimidinase n=1 Tax=Extibacter muris TaxID=1796622 RepID=UPI001D080C9B|nr:dihydropyrimidinase [Extibacter muris]MCB6201665.1 dihydropyrimidinase [Extibacter muris]MCQ4662991.1 dihydropyrimidinase [Extibacter muris]MCQ4693257.1 dihydropyrimidinase [Extibacter muris]
MKRLFRGGTVVGPESSKKTDVLVKGEKILAMGENLDFPDAEVINVEGKLLFPGFIDAHTHMDLEVSGTVTADGFDTGTKAELSGGTTCIVDFATQNKGESLTYALDHWHGKADGRSSCDYAFHLAMSDWNEKVSEELAQVTAAGIHSFKLYMTYDAMVVDDRTIYEILARLKELGAIAGVHCENKGIIDARVVEVMKKKGHREDISDYPGTRPPATEAEAVGRLLKIARCVDTPVIVVHLSSKEGLMEVRRAREAGQTVYVETCPQYLVMDESRYCLPDNEGRNYMIAPPLRSKEDQEELWQALREGEVQTVCTDHCSFTTEQKKMGEKDFSLVPCGMPGAEERPALMYHYGVRQGRLTPEQMCRYLAYHPAKLYHLYPKKGAIAPGCDADIVVWNPESEWTLSAETQKSDADYCPLEGTVLRGRAEQVYLRGELAAENGEVIKEYGGRYVTAQERTDIG